MFDNEGKMKIVTMKSKLKTKVQVTVSQRLVNKAEVVIVDGCVIPWLNQGTEEDFVTWHVNHGLRFLRIVLPAQLGPVTLVP